MIGSIIVGGIVLFVLALLLEIIMQATEKR